MLFSRMCVFGSSSVKNSLPNLLHFSFFFKNTANKHKPWLEPTYHGIVTENDNTVLLDPPLIALDKDAPLRFAGRPGSSLAPGPRGRVGGPVRGVSRPFSGWRGGSRAPCFRLF